MTVHAFIRALQEVDNDAGHVPIEPLVEIEDVSGSSFVVPTLTEGFSHLLSTAGHYMLVTEHVAGFGLGTTMTLQRRGDRVSITVHPPGGMPDIVDGRIGRQDDDSSLSEPATMRAQTAVTVAPGFTLDFVDVRVG